MPTNEFTGLHESLEDLLEEQRDRSHPRNPLYQAAGQSGVAEGGLSSALASPWYDRLSYPANRMQAPKVLGNMSAITAGIAGYHSGLEASRQAGLDAQRQDPWGWGNQADRPVHVPMPSGELPGPPAPRFDTDWSGSQGGWPGSTQAHDPAMTARMGEPAQVENPTEVADSPAPSPWPNMGASRVGARLTDT